MSRRHIRHSLDQICQCRGLGLQAWERQRDVELQGKKELAFSPEEAHSRRAVALVTSAMAVAQVRQTPGFTSYSKPLRLMDYIPPSPARMWAICKQTHSAML